MITSRLSVTVLSSLLFLVLFLLVFMLFPRNVFAAANITLVSAQIATSSSDAVLVQLDNPNSTTLSALAAASWHIDINGGGTNATTSETAIIMESSYPYTVRLTFQGPLAASYSASLGLYVDASGVTDSGSNTNTVVGHASSIAVSAVDAAAPSLSPVTIASNNASTTLAKSGDTVTVSFTSNKAIFTPGSTSTIGTHTATAARTSPTVWVTSAVMDGTDTENNVAFLLSGLRSIQGVYRANVSAITSGNNVVYDRTSPTITATAGVDTVYAGLDSYSDPGATVSDGSTLVTSGSVNRAGAGTYTITYNASDSAGNAAPTVTRTVTVLNVSGGGIFTSPASSLPGYKPPRPQIVYPDGRIVYLDGAGALSAVIPSTSSVSLPVSAMLYTRTLRGGSTGDDVVSLQTFLESKGFLKIPAGVTKGYFGSLTEQSVKKYQESVGIETVGIVGPKTRARLNTSLSQ